MRIVVSNFYCQFDHPRVPRVPPHYFTSSIFTCSGFAKSLGSRSICPYPLYQNISFFPTRPSHREWMFGSAVGKQCDS